MGDGAKENKGESKENHQEEGIFMGLSEPKWSRPRLMEAILMDLGSGKSTKDLGFGIDAGDAPKLVDDEFMNYVAMAKEKEKPPMFSLFESFYQTPFLPTFKEVETAIGEKKQEYLDRYVR